MHFLFKRTVTVVATGNHCYKSCPCLIGMAGKSGGYPRCGLTDEGLAIEDTGPNIGRACRTESCIRDGEAVEHIQPTTHNLHDPF